MKPKYSIKQQVRHLMMLDQLYRDDDRLLILKIWEQEGLVLTPKQRAIYLTMPSAAGIVRRRRELNKDFPASKTALERRYRSYKEYMDEFSSQGYLQRLIKSRRIV